MRAIYDVISGPAGPRDWNRLRSLCVPEARLTSTAKGPGSESEPVRLLTVDDYVQRGGRFFSTHPFYESAIVNRVQRFGNIAQVLSSYASSSGPTEKPFARGINSFQLFNDGTRWWVLSILWDEESPTNPLPTEMSNKPSSPVSQRHPELLCERPASAQQANQFPPNESTRKESPRSLCPHLCVLRVESFLAFPQPTYPTNRRRYYPASPIHTNRRERKTVVTFPLYRPFQKILRALSREVPSTRQISAWPSPGARTMCSGSNSLHTRPFAPSPSRQALPPWLCPRQFCSAGPPEFPG